MHRYGDMNFKVHNEAARRLWADYHAGCHVRAPMITGVSDRFFVLSPEANPRGISFYEYSNDADLMFEMQCRFAEYAAFNIIGDHEMGVPVDGWTVNVDFQNYYEAAWYGSEVKFPDNQAPYALPFLNDDNKYCLFEKGLPDPFGAFMRKAKEYYDRFWERANGKTILGQKIKNVGAAFTGLDGMFTIACELRGVADLCVDMADDPDYFHQLMAYLTQSTAERIKAWRRYIGQPEIAPAFWFADDSIMLLSCEAYKEYVLPYHKQLAGLISTGEKRGGAHLCGDATRHFKIIRDELNIYTFDTGFPVDHRTLCEELGDEVTIQGGPNAALIYGGTPEEICIESKRILESVKPVSKKFIFRDGNDIPPNTPLENIEALYAACQKYGVF